MNKRLVVIGIQEENLLYLKMQLEYILGGRIQIKGLTLKELNFGSVLSSDIVLLSAMEIQELVKPFLPDACPVLVAQRTENVVKLKELLYLQQGKRILVVNDNDNNTMQTTNSLKDILPDHHFYPYIAQKPMPESIDYVVTPGETELIPSGFPKIIDIGPRVIAIETLMELKTYFQLGIKDALFMQLYIKTMVYLTEQNTKTIPATISDQNQQRTLDQTTTQSPLLQSVIKIAYHLARTSSTIHIEGGVGTGKQMLAEMIHNASEFSALPFYVYNCSDKEPQLIKEELFGAQDQKKVGIVNSITGGTLYIKNIDQLPYALQGKLFDLIEIQDGNKADQIRIITSSLESLTKLFQHEVIRTDVYSYLSSHVLQMPSLSERKEDIAQLIEAFKSHFNRADLLFSDAVMEAFDYYNWPGNVRELYNVISYCVCLHDTTIQLDALPLFFKGNQQADHGALTGKINLNMKQMISEIETHGFLSESISLLQVYQNGKKQNESYGRRKIKTLLQDQQHHLTDQQLRLRIEVLNRLGLLNVRQGRAGTTISAKGEQFLQLYSELLVQ